MILSECIGSMRESKAAVAAVQEESGRSLRSDCEEWLTVSTEKLLRSDQSSSFVV